MLMPLAASATNGMQKKGRERDAPALNGIHFATGLKPGL